MSTPTRSLLAGRAPAVAAAVGFLVIAAFQIALALGAPLGVAAWGGTHPGPPPEGGTVTVLDARVDRWRQLRRGARRPAVPSLSRGTGQPEPHSRARWVYMPAVTVA